MAGESVGQTIARAAARALLIGVGLQLAFLPAQPGTARDAERAAQECRFGRNARPAPSIAEALERVATEARIKVAAPGELPEGGPPVPLAARSAHDVLTAVSGAARTELKYQDAWAVLRREPDAWGEGEVALRWRVTSLALLAWEFADSLTDAQIEAMAANGFIHPADLAEEQRQLLLATSLSMQDAQPDAKGRTMWDREADSRLQVAPFACIEDFTPQFDPDGPRPVFSALHGADRATWDRGVWSGPFGERPVAPERAPGSGVSVPLLPAEGNGQLAAGEWSLQSLARRARRMGVGEAHVDCLLSSRKALLFGHQMMVDEALASAIDACGCHIGEGPGVKLITDPLCEAARADDDPGYAQEIGLRRLVERVIGRYRRAAWPEGFPFTEDEVWEQMQWRASDLREARQALLRAAGLELGTAGDPDALFCVNWQLWIRRYFNYEFSTSSHVSGSPIARDD